MAILNLNSLDSETFEYVVHSVIHHMRKATENDTDLLMEVQSFWIEPTFHVLLLSEAEISHIAVGVLWWLQVRPISSSPQEPNPHNSQRPSSLLLEVSRPTRGNDIALEGPCYGM